MNFRSLWSRGDTGPENKDKKRGAPAKSEDIEALAPDYFDRAPLDVLRTGLEDIFKDMQIGTMDRSDAETLNIGFTRDGKTYQAKFKVTREDNAVTYRLQAEFFDKMGKRFHTKDVGGLDYARVEHSLKLAFSQAFVG